MAQSICSEEPSCLFRLSALLVTTSGIFVMAGSVSTLLVISFSFFCQNASKRTRESHGVTFLASAKA